MGVSTLDFEESAACKMETIKPQRVEHRQKTEKKDKLYNAFVGRLLTSLEARTNPKAIEAIKLEFDKLRSRGVWDETRMTEWESVRRDAISKNMKVHVGRLHTIATEKNHELPSNHPERKMKGRVVFLGDNVRDEFGNMALFAELSSSPVAMEGSKFVDAYGLFNGHDIEQADAEQAYVQSKLGGTPTRVRIPRQYLPKQWQYMRDPVCPLVYSLYGHPDSGGYWEAHCTKALSSAGFREISYDSWRSIFVHPVLKVVLAIYVDDLKLSGPKANLPRAWSLIRSRIKTGDQIPRLSPQSDQNKRETHYGIRHAKFPRAMLREI